MKDYEKESRRKSRMAKNLIPDVCKLLGVEVGELFKIKGGKENAKYYISKFGNFIISIDDQEDNICSDISLIDLLAGEYEIVKLPFKPKDEELYWTFKANFYDDGRAVWSLQALNWSDDSFDYALFKTGWVYRTREEAEAALPKVAEELGVEYEI